ncbi:hypothetical protein L202_08018 [Cryptococcus amylolentus CBS 6039]|uniref:Peptidase S59 domain-containing protein n=1 Tax=Cryptococcus amylolentus CBS 6039 TaxID=1295533 RepID=A0A1E3HAZ9_9TREE|nr:hypothetical protein L202_08018 [Cryptococcus amylolentus CBS 6039]ODN73518.1 hypothetical protein L202_08018 [Cryptococcus amylolentus CBS 6039]
MFGGTSSWGQNNQQNQQQQGGGLFGGGGTGGGFGQQNNTGGFGQQANTGGGFGQPAQNTGSVFGGGAATTNTGGFGGFGGANATQPTNTFGARPAFGATGSTFGQPAANTGGGGLFGSNNTTNTGFGAPANNTGGGLFGAKPTTSTFGSGATSNLFGAKPATGFGAAPAGQDGLKGPNELQQYRTDVPPPPPPSTGTANPAYYPTWQADPSTNTSLGKEGPPHLFHSVSAMFPYRGASWEELRALDYQQGRKEATPQQQQQQNAFGASSGGFGQQPAATGFGAQPAATGFGAQPAATGFGAKPAGTGLFGSSAPSTGFGSTPAAGGGLFGQSQPQQQNQGSSLFGGQSNTTTGGGLFGQSQPQQQNTGGGLFGSSTNNSSPFGGQQNQQQQGGSTFGGFGQAAKPAAFGSTGTGGFGSGSTGSTFGQQPAANTGTTGFGGFGQTQPQQQQQQPAAGGGLFGGGGFGANAQQPSTGGGLFGSQNNQQQQPAATGFGAAPKPGGLFGNSTPAPASTGFGGFGQTPAAQPAAGGGLFGNTGAAQPSTGGGLFGQSQPQQNAQQPAAGGGLFGSTSTPAAGGGLFGAKPATTTPSTGLFGSQPTQPAPSGGGLFGNAGASTGGGGGLFGSTNNNAAGQPGQQQQSGGLFGAKPAGSGLFGNTGAASTGGLFGQQPQQQQQPQAGSTGGLFGNLGQSQPASSGLFGSTAAQPQQQSTFGGGSLFGGMGQSTAQPQQQQQPSLTASIDQNPYGNNPLFAYNGQKLEVGSQSKKPALPPLTASSYRLTPSTSKSKLNKLRGFASPLTASQSTPARAGSPLSVSSPGKTSLFNSPVAPDRYKGLSDTALTPNAFVPRLNIKKLSVTPKLGGSLGGGDQLESVLGKSALRSSTNSNPGSPAPRQVPLVFHPTANATPQPESVASPRANGVDSPRLAGSERPPKKGDYWCRPKLEKLKQMPTDELSALSGFTAGRRGFGEVTFLEPVDLTRTPLDDILGAIIVVDQSELSVYPDEYPDKPEMGDGLNVPARIMLENVFTTDKATKEWVRDPQDARFQKFVRRVKAIPDTEFVSYTDDGTWTFRVEHFTTYGIGDSDEDESVASGSNSARDSSLSPSGSEDDEDMMPPVKSIRDLEGQHDSGLSEDDFTGESIADDFDGDLTDMDTSGEFDLPSHPSIEIPLKSHLGPEGMRNLKEMQSSFFGPSAPTMRPARELAGSRKRGAEQGSFFREAEEENMMLDKRAVKRTSFGEPPVSLPIIRQKRKYARVAVDESIEKGKEGVKVDAGLALGRSWRCSWGPNGELVHLGKICGPRAKTFCNPDAVVNIEKVETLAESVNVEKSKAERLLALHLETSLVEQIEGVPFAIVNPDIRFGDFASRFDAGDRSHEANVFRLGVALFDEIDLRLPEDSSEELVHRITSLRRKLALSKWLEDAVASSVDSDLITNSDSRPNKLFTLLSGHQVERAVETALEGGDMRLATLISQSGGQQTFKDELLLQLEDWENHKVNPFIAAGYRRIYALLAGITDVLAGSPPGRVSEKWPQILIAEGLDWKRAFGLHLWYGMPFENTISDVVSSFASSLSAVNPPAKPLPPHLEKPSEGVRSWTLPTEPTDVIYNLLQLYSDDAVSLDQTLRSRDTSSSPFDVRLAWHLYILLARVFGRRDFEDREEEYSASADRLTAGYAAQLEESGEWKLAAFVLLHLETVEGREKSLRALLNRHPDVTADDTSFLVETLRIPAEWIHAARAAAFTSSGDAWKEYHALLEARLFDRAHRVLLERLAPEAIIRDDRALLKKLCLKLEGKGVAGWEFGGKLFLEWNEISEDTAPLLMSVLRSGSRPDPRQVAELNERAQVLPRLLQLLPSLFSDRNDVQQVAGLSEILSPLADLASALSGAGYIAKQPVSVNLVDEDRLHLLRESAFEAFNRTLAEGA